MVSSILVRKIRAPVAFGRHRGNITANPIAVEVEYRAYLAEKLGNQALGKPMPYVSGCTRQGNI
ncbi:hypothetical protein AJ80_03841 [Polytolypa hystricis UAMH7299]|uniref:Uncharacterized protein n=1 Tax=Polytolypa hystricis (strain UAMH7299) TaxID=1447883 RepID=A0A2B7YDS4_POLH7|nr:hypothetical protein AJ80_03841 [Polytolypa hystricis UAMH7299]